jgi:ABC-type polysaccharide/polyol phosphate transport system ATPase subunit
MSEVAINIQNIGKSYRLFDRPIDRLKHTLFWRFGRKFGREFWALKDVSFEIHRGETVGILGINGAGKSTLLQIIAGTLQPTEGQTIVNGRVSALLELGSGFNVEYTGRENIFLNGAILGLTNEEIIDRYDKILAFADIGNFLEQPVKTYSSGMVMRLAFAVAINVDPDILIVDEALAVGDIFFQAKCYRKFAEFQSQGKTILFVTHATDSVLKYCNRAVVLHEGQLVAQGKPGDMVNIYKKLMSGNINNGSHGFELQKTGIEDGNLAWKTQLSLNPNYLEYGNKMAEIADFAIVNNQGEITSRILEDEEFQIIIKIFFHSTICEPIFAFTIKDIKGNEVAGTNSLLENVIIQKVDSGTTVIATFMQRVPLYNTTYLLSLGCTGYSGDDLIVYHRLYDVSLLEFIGARSCVGFCNPLSKINIKLNSRNA